MAYHTSNEHSENTVKCENNLPLRVLETILLGPLDSAYIPLSYRATFCASESTFG